MSCIQSENGGNAFKTSAESDLIADFISDSVIGLFRCSFASWLSSATWHVSGNLSLSWKSFRWEWCHVVVPDWLFSVYLRYPLYVPLFISDSMVSNPLPLFVISWANGYLFCFLIQRMKSLFHRFCLLFFWSLIYFLPYFDKYKNSISDKTGLHSFVSYRWAYFILILKFYEKKCNYEQHWK